MTQTYKRIARNTMFLYFRMILMMAVSFYTVRVVLDVLGFTDYGLYNLVTSYMAVIVFLNGTLASGTQRFLTFEIGRNDLLKLQQTFSLALLLHIGLAIIIVVLAETVGLWFLYEKMNIPADRFDAAFWLYQFAVLSAILSVTQVPYNALIIAHEKMDIFAYISIVEVVLKLLIVYLLFISPYDKLITYGLLIFIVSLAIALYYRWYVMKNHQESHFKYFFDKKIVNSMLHFSGWNILGTLGSLLSNQGILIILNIFFGPIAVAARAISMQISNGLMQFVSGFQQALNPQITKLYASNQREELNALLYQNSKYSFLLLWLLALPVLMQLNYILTLWLGNVPENTYIFTILTIVYMLIFSIHTPFVQAIHATGNMKETNIRSSIINIASLPISYILLQKGFPIFTPLVIIILTRLISFSIDLYYLNKWIQISYLSFFKLVFKPIILVASFSFISIFYISEQLASQDLIDFIFMSIFSFVTILLLAYFIVLSQQEKRKLNAKIKIFIEKSMYVLIKKQNLRND